MFCGSSLKERCTSSSTYAITIDCELSPIHDDAQSHGLFRRLARHLAKQYRSDPQILGRSRLEEPQWRDTNAWAPKWNPYLPFHHSSLITNHSSFITHHSSLVTHGNLIPGRQYDTRGIARGLLRQALSLLYGWRSALRIKKNRRKTLFGNALTSRMATVGQLSNATKVSTAVIQYVGAAYNTTNGTPSTTPCKQYRPRR